MKVIQAIALYCIFILGLVLVSDKQLVVSFCSGRSPSRKENFADFSQSPQADPVSTYLTGMSANDNNSFNTLADPGIVQFNSTRNSIDYLDRNTATVAYSQMLHNKYPVSDYNIKPFDSFERNFGPVFQSFNPS